MERQDIAELARLPRKGDRKAMGVSAGTVKSRLSAARAVLRVNVEDEERRGNKLYVLFPYLGKVLTDHLRKTAVSDDFTKAAQAGMSQAGALSATGSTAGGDAATAGEATAGAAVTATSASATVGMRLAIKIGAGVLAAAVLVTGVFVLTGKPASPIAPTPVLFATPTPETTLPDSPAPTPHCYTPITERENAT